MSKKIIILGSISTVAIGGVVAGATAGVLAWKKAREVSNTYAWGQPLINKLTAIKDSGLKAYEILINGEKHIYTSFVEAVEALGFKKVSEGYEKDGKIYRDMDELKQFGVYDTTGIKVLNEFSLFDFSPSTPIEANAASMITINGKTYKMIDQTKTQHLANPNWFLTEESANVYEADATPKTLIDTYTHDSNGVKKYISITGNQNTFYPSKDVALSMNSLLNAGTQPLEASGDISFIDAANKTRNLHYFTANDPENPTAKINPFPPKTDLSQYSEVMDHDIFEKNGKYYEYLSKTSTPGYEAPNYNGAFSVQKNIDHPGYMQNNFFWWEKEYYHNSSEERARGFVADNPHLNTTNKMWTDDRLIKVDISDFGVRVNGKRIFVFSGGYADSGGSSIFNTEKPYSFVVQNNDGSNKEFKSIDDLNTDANFASGGLFQGYQKTDPIFTELFDKRLRDKTGNDTYLAMPNPKIAVFAIRTLPEVGKVWKATNGHLFAGPSAVPGYVAEKQPTPEGWHDITTINGTTPLGQAVSNISADLQSVYRWNKNEPANKRVFSYDYKNANTSYVADVPAISGWFEVKTQAVLYTKADEQVDPSHKEGNIKTQATYEGQPFSESLQNTYYFNEKGVSIYIKNKDKALEYAGIGEFDLDSVDKTSSITVVESRISRKAFQYVSETKPHQFERKMIDDSNWDGTVQGINDENTLSQEEYDKLFIYTMNIPSELSSSKINGSERYFTDKSAAIAAAGISIINRQMFLSSEGFEIKETASESELKKIDLLIFDPNIILGEKDVLLNDLIVLDSITYKPVLVKK